MTFAVRLSTHVWNPLGDRRALLLHGLGSDGTCWWRLASELADDGFMVVAPDLRSHGASPTAADHGIDALTADVAALGDGWDLVVGHSLGGSIAAALLADPAAAHAAVLVDPVLWLPPAAREQLRQELRADVGRADPDGVRAANPGWDERDVQRKARAAAAVTPDVVDAVFADNDPWGGLDRLPAWQARVHLMAADPELGALLTPDLAAKVADGQRVTFEVVAGVGHSIYRERPDAVRVAVTHVLSAL